MGCAEGPRLSENITVPDTKVNFNAWKRMEVRSIFFPFLEVGGSQSDILIVWEKE